MTNNFNGREDNFDQMIILVKKRYIFDSPLPPYLKKNIVIPDDTFMIS